MSEAARPTSQEFSARFAAQLWSIRDELPVVERLPDGSLVQLHEVFDGLLTTPGAYLLLYTRLPEGRWASRLERYPSATHAREAIATLREQRSRRAA